MKLLKKIGIAVIILFVVGIIGQIGYFIYLSPSEDYPEDSYLATAKNKVALIVVAHDDDASFFSGTISKLRNAGWELNFITFYSKQWRPEEYEIRKKEQKQVAEYLNFKHLEMHDVRIRLEVEKDSKPWMPISYNRFEAEFNLDSLSLLITEIIRKTKPSTIFMLDKEMGFYGHNDHTVVGRVTHEASKKLNQEVNTVEKIYQYVWPKDYADKVMGGKEVYDSAKAIYQLAGMPQPTVQVNISDYASDKKRVLQLYASQQRNLTKLFWGYNYYPSWLYFGIFDKEYFNVIEF